MCIRDRTNATLPYVIALANKGWKKACKDNPALALGLNICLLYTSYTLPQEWLHKININGATVALEGRNLFVFDLATGVE